MNSNQSVEFKENKIIYMDPSSLHPYEKNPRINDEAVKYVMQSIKDFGFKNPIIVDKDLVIICGHTRLKAAKNMQLKSVPVLIADDLTPQQVKAFRLADNKVAEKAQWDLLLLNEELQGLLENGFDMESLGFDSMEDVLDLDNEEAEEDDFNVDDALEEEPIIKPGEIWQLGNHRLMCGDSTNPDDVEKLMNGEQADLVVTDPPYNVAIENSAGMTIENDNMSGAAFLEFLTNAFNCLNLNLKEGGAFYVWFASREHVNFETALNNNNLKVRQELIWNKNSMILGRQDYQWKHEPCLYGWKDGAAHYFIDDRSQTTVIEDTKPDFKKMSKADMQALLEEIYSDKISTTIINEKKPSVNDLHPTMKPLTLISRQVKNSSRKGELVLDLFGGSGSTMMTCEQVSRRCNMMEYDPKYATVIIKRWEALTGLTATKIK